MRLTYIDPRFNSVPAEFRFLAGQKYIGYSNETNTTNKIKALYGKTWAELVKTLSVGQFLYHKAPGEPELISIPKYIPTTKPLLTVTSEPVKPILFETMGYILGLGIGVLFLYPLIKLLSFF